MIGEHSSKLEVYCDICEEYVNEVVPIKYVYPNREDVFACSVCVKCLEIVSAYHMFIIHRGKPLISEVV